MKFKFAILLLVFISCSFLYGWENKLTHPAITTQAVNSSAAQIDDYLKTQLGLSGGLLTQLYWNFPSDIKERMTKNNKVDPNKTKTILDWLKAGSTIEDEDGRWKAPWRPRHHFYDPTRNAGLDNHAAHPNWTAPGWSSWLPLGQSALNWAIEGSASYEPYTNNDKWSDVRNLFYSALTAQTQSDRQSYLAESMMKLGCVLHLLEDMGVPAHTRNDFLYGHYRSVYEWDWGNDLEDDVETKVAANGGNSLWSGTGAVAFDKLTKYFDTDTRDPDHYLGSGVLPPATWGLAEATNYQFMSLSTVFGSYLLKYYFPHPSMAYMGTPIEVEMGAGERKIYFNGVNYGVSHIARESYTYHYAKYNNIYAQLTPDMQHEIDSTITTDDQMVFDDYANITIPRTINYVTGLANYFFRGRLSATAKCVECNVIELTITNKSVNSGVQQTLKSGSFEIYWDNGASDRTQITDFVIDGGWTSSSTLAYDGNIKATFIKPAGASLVKYVVVYEGNICENPASPDSDDENAIATTAVAAPSNDCCPPPFSCPFSLTTCDELTCWPSGEVPDHLIIKFSGIRCCGDNNLAVELNTCFCLGLLKYPDVSEGESRYEFQGRMNVCGTEHWIIIAAGYTEENPWLGSISILDPQIADFFDWGYPSYPLPCPPGSYPNQLGCNYNHGHEGVATLIDPSNYLLPETWQDNHFYSVGDTVVGTDANFYSCKTAHTSSSSNRPVSAGNWSTYWQLTETKCE